MKRKRDLRKNLYYTVNILFLIVSFIFFYDRFTGAFIKTDGVYEFNIAYMLLSALLVGMIYFIKTVRLYIIMLDTHIPFRRFVKVYIKSSFVSIILPFKTGDLFKMYCYGHETEDYKIGIFSVLVERYFDTISLLVILAVFTLSTGNGIVPVVILMALFLILLTAFFISFPSINNYINRFCIVSTDSPGGIDVLRFLSGINNWYMYAKKLVDQRVPLLLIMSTFTWIAEYGVIKIFIYGLGKSTASDLFLVYINSVFSGSNDIYVTLYMSVSVLLFGILFVTIYISSYVGKVINTK